MHKSSHNEMRVNLLKHCEVELRTRLVVLDIGSLDVNGSYRDLMPPCWTYVGTDLRPGPNVDVPMKDPFSIPLHDEAVNLVISGQCLEHCTNPFRLVAEAVRVLTPGGKMILVAPFIFRKHKETVDCFRFLPDGMAAIFDECGIEMIRTYLNPPTGNAAIDCWAIGRKPCA